MKTKLTKTVINGNYCIKGSKWDLPTNAVL